MTTKVKEKKVMTENDKLEKVIKLFLEIKELFPENSCNLSIHKVDIKLIDRKIWEIHANLYEDSLETFLVAKNDCGESMFGITLYGKD